jgi:hypothetical protein
MHIRIKDNVLCIEKTLFDTEGKEVANGSSALGILGEHELSDTDGRKYIAGIETYKN